MARAYTAEEVRAMFLEHIHKSVDFWDKVKDRSCKEKLSGLAFSILNLFDGTTVGFPAVDLSLAPHESDEDYRKERGRNWFQPGMVINNCMLHEEYSEERNERHDS